jgi:hypothetical protein
MKLFGQRTLYCVDERLEDRFKESRSVCVERISYIPITYSLRSVRRLAFSMEVARINQELLNVCWAPKWLFSLPPVP